MESVRSAMEDSDGSPESHRAAMAKALEENGFDPAEVQSRMGPPPGVGGPGQRGGNSANFAASSEDLGSLLESTSYGTADELIQQLLSRLPAGSALDLHA